jgi:hypothetical protein
MAQDEEQRRNDEVEIEQYGAGLPNALRAGYCSAWSAVVAARAI